jgi:peptide/nickel transport system substrate-binding protein
MKTLVYAIFLSAAFLLLSGPFAYAEQATAKPRGEIRVVETWRPDINVLAHNVLQYLFEYALDRNDLAPSLAVSREWINDTTLELKLRKGVRFHNGEPFDAKAVKFNFDYQRQHNPSRGIQIYLKNATEIQVVDPYTLRMVLDQPNAIILNNIVAGPKSGWVIGAPRYMKDVGWEKFLRRPIGTGPFKVLGEVKDYRKARDGEIYATLTANEDYWRNGYPKIKKVSFVQYSSQEAIRALTEGRVDLVTSLIPKDTLRIEESIHSKVIKGRNDVRTTFAYLNMLSPHTFPLRNLLVRKALNYAVNKEELKKYAFNGNALEMRGMLTEKSGIDLSDTRDYGWNIPKARDLMKEAGYGEGFKMTLHYQEKDFLIARLLKRFFSLIQIEVELEQMDWEWFVSHVVYPNTRAGHSWKNEKWWMTLTTAPSYMPEILGLMLPAIFSSGAPWKTFPDWLALPLDNMYQELLKAKSRKKRFHIYKEANDYIADQALQLFTMAGLGLYGVNEEVNFVPQISQYLYLDYSTVTDNHWSVVNKTN